MENENKKLNIEIPESMFRIVSILLARNFVMVKKPLGH